MIWSLVTRDEMENYKIPPIFHSYEEALGRDNVKLAVVDEADTLSFVGKRDIVLLRSANNTLVETIKRSGFKTTAEDVDTYKAANDKTFLAVLLNRNKINVPKQFRINEISDGKMYFVKPRFGSESFGVSEKSICSSLLEVEERCRYLSCELKREPVIEEYIEGVDCTVACYYVPVLDKIKTHAIKVECNSKGGVQTHKGKFDYDEFCSPTDAKTSQRLSDICREVCNLLGIKHHARIDFRMSLDGKLYLIDINLIPGLGPLAHFAKCLLLTENLSYTDMLNRILNSST